MAHVDDRWHVTGADGGKREVTHLRELAELEKWLAGEGR